MTENSSEKQRIDARSILEKCQDGLRTIWERSALYNLVLLLISVGLFAWILASAFAAQATCDYLITQSLSMPSFLCTGKNFSPLGSVPGLDSALDAPLEGLRRLFLWGSFFLLVALSGYLTLILNNLKKVVKLVTFNKQQWQEFFAVLRLFFTLLVFFLLIFAWVVF